MKRNFYLSDTSDCSIAQINLESGTIASLIWLKWFLRTDKRANKFAIYFGAFATRERC